MFRSRLMFKIRKNPAVLTLIALSMFYIGLSSYQEIAFMRIVLWSPNRWDVKFHEAFDVPDPIASSLGPDNVTFRNKYVIYRCDEDTMKNCGGWADRVRGMFTAYLLANLTGRVFKAELLMSGCDIRKFIAPNFVDWNLPKSFHQRVVPSKSVKMLDMWGQPDFYEMFQTTDWTNHPAMLKSDYFYFKGNHDNLDNFKDSKFQWKSLQWMQHYNRVELNSFLFKHLLRPTPYLQEKVTTFLSKHVHYYDKLICVHLRMGKNPTIPKETRASIKRKYLPNVWGVLRNLVYKYDNYVKIFVMSDSSQAIAKIKKQKFANKVFFAPGEIIHIELTNGINEKERCDGFEKVLFEQQVLMHCDEMIISDSGISRMAAYVRGRDDGMYCFLRRGVVIHCKLMDIKIKHYRTRG